MLFERGLLAVTALALGLVGCSSADDLTGAHGDEVIGGVDANSPTLNAVGALVREMPAGQPRQKFCTATLVAPSIVLTAKHCVLLDASNPNSTRFMDQSAVFFSIGPDVRKPLRQIRVTDIRISSLHRGGYTGLGSDVALHLLSEPVTDIAPMAIASGPLHASDNGTEFTGIGYGVQDMALTNGTRKMGRLTLRAVDGPPAHIVYESFDTYVADNRDQGAPPLTDAERPGWKAAFDLPLLRDNQALLGNLPGDVQVCHGDSGGPLLRRVGSSFVVSGVASWTMGTKPGTTAFCERGAVYATFGPEARQVIDATLHGR